MMTLQDQHVLIVGGSRGIGAASARLAGSLGAKVSIIYHSNRAAAEAVQEAIGGETSIHQADASVEDELKSAIDVAVAVHGPIFGLVVSAGMFEGLSIDEMTVDFWDRVMAVNLRSTFLSVKHAVPSMRAGGGGSIVIYTSTAGQRGSAIYSAYATSKGAQIMFMRSMALELGPTIRVNCIAPAWTETDMADASLTKLGRDEVAKGFVLGRIGLPEDVAKATCFMLSDAAGFITGTTLTVDGGADMRG